MLIASVLPSVTSQNKKSAVNLRYLHSQWLSHSIFDIGSKVGQSQAEFQKPAKP